MCFPPAESESHQTPENQRMKVRAKRVFGLLFVCLFSIRSVLAGRPLTFSTRKKKTEEQNGGGEAGRVKLQGIKAGRQSAALHIRLFQSSDWFSAVTQELTVILL